jgi:hypothetical protein
MTELPTSMVTNLGNPHCRFLKAFAPFHPPLLAVEACVCTRTRILVTIIGVFPLVDHLGTALRSGERYDLLLLN